MGIEVEFLVSVRSSLRLLQLVELTLNLTQKFRLKTLDLMAKSWLRVFATHARSQLER